uniref:Uncharacterized protein n=1 Tax=Oryza rufipogon TaxID=4529 RepID=A0A0E0PGR5_ORYRU
MELLLVFAPPLASPPDLKSLPDFSVDFGDGESSKKSQNAGGANAERDKRASTREKQMQILRNHELN